MSKIIDYEATQMTGVSMNVKEDRLAQLRKMFPEVFTESTTADGKEVTFLIDFERLKAELGEFTEDFEARRERYGMNWPGKRNAIALSQKQTTLTLNPCPEESVNFDTTENLYIEGDNLEALQILRKSYFGKVKMIYIDPPYNTGNDFVYSDKYAESEDEYLRYAGQDGRYVDAQSANSKENGRYHSKWLNMMYPRLKIACELLREDGVIFISIDDNEVSNLRKMCDEIFGEDSLVGVFSWKNKYGAGAKTKGLIEVHEYILCYSKSKMLDIEAELTKEQMLEYDKKKDEKYAVRGGYITQPLMTKSLDDRINLQYTITFNGDIIKPRKQWVWEEQRLLKAIQDNEVVFKKKKNGEYSVRAKVYLKSVLGVVRKGKPISTLNGPFNQDGTEEVAELLGEDIFSFPKPTKLLQYFFSFILNNTEDKNGIYLDFFSGSATTAHAIFVVNKQDDGHRKFILVQLPELCSPDTEAYKSGYKNICEIGKERIRRVGTKIKAEIDEANKQSDMLSGQKKLPDIGFRVLKVSPSNFQPWGRLMSTDATVAEVYKQMELTVNNVNQNSAQIALLFELLIKGGFMPTEENVLLELREGSLQACADTTSKLPRVYSVMEGALLVCLEQKMTQALLDAVLALSPAQFICLDTAFEGNDQLKANAVQTFMVYQRKDVSLKTFKTV
jgi:adenine-specific DNA-methyltransferase